MTPQHRHLLTIFETYKMIGLYRCADRNSGFLFDLGSFDDAETGKRVVDRTDEERNIRYGNRAEEQTSELRSLMRISYAIFCLKKKKHKDDTIELIKIIITMSVLIDNTQMTCMLIIYK